jgi:hypothetical protein
MKRSGFARKTPAAYTKAERVAPVLARLTVKVNMPRVSDEVVTISKEAPARSEAYRRAVAALPCAHCGIVGFTQFCHSDEGKGMAIKSDDRTGWPGCGTRPGEIGCHSMIGSTGSMTRDQRRALEADYAARTRQTIFESGQWPKNLTKLDELELT